MQLLQKGHGLILKKCFRYKKLYIFYFNITAVTSEATGISGRLMNIILKIGKESLGKGELYEYFCISLFARERNTQKK